ncbi:MAG: SDR family NAD(P)-dependent oxidoreductase [Geminicoccaceae bacterium]
MTRPMALITGASSGIGKELARAHAMAGGDVILTARRKSPLESLQHELHETYGIAAAVMAVDLTDPNGCQLLYDNIKSQDLKVDILINNAGFGGHGFFHERDLDWNLAMVDLNVKAIMSLTHLCLQDMLARGHGKILNVGSTAAMIPGPLHATYHASKAFVSSFSQALANELEGTGITVTMLAPGPVDTDFFDVSDMRKVKAIQWEMASAANVAKVGYDAMMKGRLLAYNDWRLKFLLDWIVPLLPRRIALRSIRKVFDVDLKGMR